MDISKIVKTFSSYVSTLPQNILLITGVSLLAVLVIAIVVVVVAIFAKKSKKNTVDQKFRILEETICTDSSVVVS